MDRIVGIKLGMEIIKERWRETVSREELSALLTSNEKSNFVRLMNDAAKVADGFVFGGKIEDDFEESVSYAVDRCDRKIAAAALLYAGVTFAERLIVKFDDPADKYPYADWIEAFADSREGIARKRKQDASVNRMFTKRNGDKARFDKAAPNVLEDAISKLEIVERALHRTLNAS